MKRHKLCRYFLENGNKAGENEITDIPDDVYIKFIILQINIYLKLKIVNVV